MMPEAQIVCIRIYRMMIRLMRFLRVKLKTGKYKTKKAATTFRRNCLIINGG